MRVIHLYPFPLAGVNGGSLRLRAAHAATTRLGPSEVHTFDPQTLVWRQAAPPAPGERRTSAGVSEPELLDSLRRRLLPSTMWEAGRRAVRTLRPYLTKLELDRALVVLHTTYLASSGGQVRSLGARLLTDVYDLVWLAHRNDASHCRGALRAFRRAYAGAVRVREQAAIAASDHVVAAGYEDCDRVRERVADATWIPTPTPIDPVPEPPTAEGRLTIGFVGNFAHASTSASALGLLASPAAADTGVRIRFAGVGSTEFAARFSGSEGLGALDRVEPFYSELDCVVVPVTAGSGIKCKLGEAILAGRPVLTTTLGAAGYSPDLRAHFSLTEAGEITGPRIREAIERFDRERARAAFERVLGWNAVIDAYGRAAERALAGDESPAPRKSRQDSSR